MLSVQVQLQAYLWVVGSLHEICIDIFNLDLPARCRICDRLSSTYYPSWLAWFVIPSSILGPLSGVHLRLDLGVSFLLIDI
jgi:hypothetical protein